MTRVITLSEIKNCLDFEALSQELEKGFVAYSDGQTQIPLPGHLTFDNPYGDCHIKYGYIEGDEHFVVKIATGFYENYKLGLPSGHGMMAVFSRFSGELKAILVDEGYLTDIRTAIAGQIVARYLAPRSFELIGVIGSGTQARLQVTLLSNITSCRELLVWGRKSEHLDMYQQDLKRKGFTVYTTKHLDEIPQSCSLIITTTPSTVPLIRGENLRPGTHITAVGADGSGKQEIDPNVFKLADRCVVDSLAQCSIHGDASYALKSQAVTPEQLVELGNVIQNPEIYARKNDNEITIADLTGLAVQDIQIASWVYRNVIA